MSFPTDFDLGDTVVLEATFTKAGVAAAPAAVTITVTDPDGQTSTPAVTAAGGGVYRATFTPTKAGNHNWHAAGTGTDQGAGDDHFYVRRPPA